MERVSVERDAGERARDDERGGWSEREGFHRATERRHVERDEPAGCIAHQKRTGWITCRVAGRAIDMAETERETRGGSELNTRPSAIDYFFAFIILFTYIYILFNLK